MLTLKNEYMEIKVSEPWEHYKSSRFSQTGFIPSVKYKGIEICGQEDEIPREGVSGCGICGEFGIFTPIGYEECPVGGFFPKPGVGSLQKKDGPYRFYDEFLFRPEFIRWEQQGNCLRFYTQSENRNGYEVQTEKVLTLEGETLKIAYTVKNQGIKPVETEEYYHNFIRIGEGPIEKEYLIRTGGRAEEAEISPMFEVEGETMRPGDTVREVHYSRMNPLKGQPYRWEIVNEKEGLSISEHTSFLPEFVAVWGKQEVISVEAFKKISLLPGEEETYDRIYAIREIR